MMQDNSQDSLSAALQPTVTPRRASVQPVLLISVLALLISAGFGFYQFRMAQTLKAEISRSQTINSQAQLDLQALQKNADQNRQQLEARFALIEAHQAEVHNQQETLSAMYDTLTRADTARSLAEIEQILTFTSQQLQLTGNIPAAKSTLSGIDQKLAQLNHPELISLRQALAKDSDALKALPAFDLAGIALKLDNLANTVDRLPLTIDSFREPTTPAPRTEGDPITRFTAELWHELKQLIQIRRMDQPDALLLSPEQSYFARETIKLRLIDARTALLLHDQATYHADLVAVQSYLRQHFNVNAPQTATAQALIEQLIAQPLALKLPDLGNSLTAVRNARSTVERAKP